jgi:xylan 1,4-beta-xylosidase
MQITRRHLLYSIGGTLAISATRSAFSATKSLGLSNTTAKTSSQSRAAVILRGEFPDPTIVRDGTDFYMTHSHDDIYVPSLLIWHSTDLYHWTPIGHALHNFPHVVEAPELVKYKDLFYLYLPTMGSVYATTARNPAGPWSDLVNLKVGGSDPGHVVGQDGKRYLYTGGGMVIPLADDGLSASGDRLRAYEGWKYSEDWNVECFCLESPKLVFHDGYYYLTSAQGGTTGPATSHMIVSARSRSPLGPWENSPYNPIVHTWSAREPWWSKGHGTLIDDGKGRWYIVYHAYENGHRELGRQTLIEPVEWTKDGWFRSPYASGKGFNPQIIRNNAIHSDDFSKPELNLQWQFGGLKVPPEYRLENGSVRIKGSSEGIRVMHCRPSDPNYEASFKLEGPSNTEYGLMVLYKPSIDVCAGIGTQGNRVFSIRRGRSTRPETPSGDCRYFKIQVKDHDLAAYYSVDGKTWKLHPEGSSISGYDENSLGGYASLKIAAYIKGEGELKISDFVYRPLA